MKGLKDTWRSDYFKLQALTSVTLSHILLDINLHSFPKEGLSYIVVCFEKTHMAYKRRIIILFQDLIFEFGRVG
jgi:hypothetical protein